MPERPVAGVKTLTTMFRRRSSPTSTSVAATPAPTERITSVLGSGINWKGQLGGSGGVRIEGTFDGDVALRGLLVIGETGRLTCEHVRANTVIVAGLVRGDITAEKLEIRATGRVWGNVVVAAFTTEEGAFLRGQIRMEEHVDLGLAPPPPEVAELGEGEAQASTAENSIE